MDVNILSRLSEWEGVDTPLAALNNIQEECINSIALQECYLRLKFVIKYLASCYFKKGGRRHWVVYYTSPQSLIIKILLYQLWVR